ncbi:response regulator transcription factor [Solicola sp. PLA-1-18]|uniref:helix-turn-helix transcriptional regulator n=1 Tax=Solicola sp. PLA-1-18 TaxID=3380532 RepID=UPI003B7B660C
MVEAAGTALGRIAASAAPLPERALDLLLALRSCIPFDGAWVAYADPRGSRYQSLASVDLDDDVLELFSGPAMAHDITATGGDRDRAPVSRSDPGHPSPEERTTWSECLTSAGMHESLSVALFARGGRHVGFVTLLSRSRSAPTRAMRRRLAMLAPVLALGIDPMPCLVATTRMARGVTAGIVIRDDGRTETLPGVLGDLLLAPGSPVLEIARRRLGLGSLYSSFLWPLGGPFAPDGHARITVVAAPDDVPTLLVGVAMVSAPQHLHGLTTRELEVLGLVVDGRSNQQIAHALVVAPRTVAAHVEHVLVKLDVTSRTTAAVLAEREGLYVPPQPAPRAGSPAAAGA